ncbi:MAG TPA: recombination mediator RecR [Patescibacteria group bacterium]
MKVPKVVQELIEAFERLPGIGPKSAARLTYYLLHAPKEESLKLSEAAARLKSETKLCSNCRNITQEDPCEICSDSKRDSSTICVVEHPLDVLAFERSGGYEGKYHVLHGSISPLQNIGPDELHIKELLPRLKNGVKEVVLATNQTMEGEATAMYVQRLILPLKLKITRLARGLPAGADLEYADDVTLRRAIENRSEF